MKASLSAFAVKAPRRAGRRRVLLGFLLVYCLWGSTYLAVRYGLESFPPFFLAAARFLMAGPILYAWARWRGAARPEPAHWRSAAVLGAFMLLGGNGGVVFAQQHVSSGLASLMVSTIPLWMVMLDWRGRKHRRPSKGLWAGMALGALGVSQLVAPSAGAVGAVPPVWAAVLLAASLSWALGSLYSRKARLPASSILTTGMQMMTGGLLLLAAGVIHGEPARLDLARVSVRSWLALGYLSAFGAVLGFSAYLWLLRTVSVASVSTYAFVNPLVAVALGCWIAAEPLTPRMIAAGGLILLGVAMIILFRSTPAPKNSAEHAKMKHSSRTSTEGVRK